MADEEMIVEDDEDSTQENKYLLFYLGEEEYGVNIAMVQSIEELQKIVTVPDMPEYVKGVINLRGKVIPVVDLRIKFHMDEREYDDRTCMIITRLGENDLGFIVDTVSEVEDIPERDIEPPPEFKSDGVSNTYIAGIGKVGEDVKILLDAGKIMSSTELEEIKQNV